MLGQSQENINCKFVDSQTSQECDYTDFTVYTNPALSIDPDYLATFEPVVINIFFWDVLNDDGQSINNATPFGDFEKEALDVVAEANIMYNPFNIFFKYLGHGQIHDTYLVGTDALEDDTDIDVDIWQLSSRIGGHIYVTLDPELSSNLDDLRNANAYNVYVSGNGDSAGGAGFRTGYPLHSQSRETFIDNTGKHRHTLHEIGHSLGLDHTWSDFGTPENVATGITVLSGCERVPRSPGNSYFNVPNHGDKVLDTASTPNFQTERWYELFWSQLEVLYLDGSATAEDYYAARDFANANYNPTTDAYINAQNCTYTGTNKDCYREDAYQLFYKDTNNLMAYTKDCTGHVLTTGQAIRMRETIALDCNEAMGPALNTLGVASLYEPYKGNYPAPPFGYHSNLIKPLFQPDFEYRFVECECECNEPIPWDDTSFAFDTTNIVLQIEEDEIDYNAIIHPNHTAIQIMHPSFGAQPRRCYSNYNSPPIIKPISGIVVKFNDNVLNTNVTITTQDSTEINNPNLIDELNPGLYNIIEQYNDGTTEEQVILKSGN